MNGVLSQPSSRLPKHRRHANRGGGVQLVLTAVMVMVVVMDVAGKVARFVRFRAGRGICSSTPGDGVGQSQRLIENNIYFFQLMQLSLDLTNM